MLLSTLFSIVISGFYTLDILWIWIFLVFFWIKKKQFNLSQIGNYVLNLCGGGDGSGDGVRVSGVSGVGIRVPLVGVACIVGGSIPGVGNLRSGCVLDWCSNLVDIGCSNLVDVRCSSMDIGGRCGNSVDIGGSSVHIRCGSVHIGGSCDISVDVGFSCNLDINVSFSGDIFMNVCLSSDICMNVFLSSGAFVNVFYGS